MIGQYIGCSVLFGLIGYVIGSISWAIIISRTLKKEDIRTKGSGNAGATNIVRNYGKKIGGLVFILDLVKPLMAVVIAWSIKEYSNVSAFKGALVQMAGFFAVVGHCYPLYFKFKGGKGAATNAGFFLSTNWLLFPIGIILFLGILKTTKKVSIGSLMAPAIMIFLQIAFAFIPHMNERWLNHFMQEPTWWVNTIFLVLILALSTWKHRDNIKRLLKGQERSVGSKNK